MTALEEGLSNLIAASLIISSSRVNRYLWKRGKRPFKGRFVEWTIKFALVFPQVASEVGGCIKDGDVLFCAR